LFDKLDDAVLDFAESNPFGDPTWLIIILL
jgi:hypothetical protein